MASGLSFVDHRYVDTKSRQNNSICVNHSSHIPQRVEKKTLWLIVSIYIYTVSICWNVETKSFYVPLHVMENSIFIFFRVLNNLTIGF